MTSEQLRELPLNRRDYMRLVLLSPGTLTQPGLRIGGATTAESGTPEPGNRTFYEFSMSGA